MNDWDKERGKLNHDLLKNQIIPSLDRLKRVADGRISGEGILEDAVAHLLHVWSEFQPAMYILLHDDHEVLRPEKWFSEPPLNKLTERDRIWMKALVCRHAAEVTLPGKEKAITELEILDRSLKQLAQELPTTTDAGMSQRLSVLRKKMGDLSYRLSALSFSKRLLERLPDSEQRETREVR